MATGFLNPQSLDKLVPGNHPLDKKLNVGIALMKEKHGIKGAGVSSSASSSGSWSQAQLQTPSTIVQQRGAVASGSVSSSASGAVPSLTDLDWSNDEAIVKFIRHPKGQGIARIFNFLVPFRVDNNGKVNDR